MTTATSNSHSLAADPFFEPLKEYLISTTGLHYYHDRSTELASHIARHLEHVGLTDCLSYLELLQDGSAGDEELDCLIEDLTVGETYFFRDPDLVTALEQAILPQVIEKNRKQRRLRIWSAGSSTGAEAYTVSILLRRRLAHRIPHWDVTITGTDINRSFLSRATAGRYDEWALRGVADDVKQQSFTRCGQWWDIKPTYKDGVSFLYHNLVNHPLPSLLHNLFAFDVILCRNVMIYFSESVIDRTIANMRRCLVDGGWLLVGHSEHKPGRFRDFSTFTFDGATAYQRNDGHVDRTPSISPLNSFVRAIPPAQDSHRPTARKGHIPKPPPSPLSGDTPITPPDDEPSGELGHLRDLADRGEIERAEIQCRRLLKADKLNPAWSFYHALILEQLGQHSTSERALRHAIYLDRTFVLAHYYLALSQQRKGRRAEAARLLRNVRQILATHDGASEIEDGDGLTVAQLDALAHMQLRTIEA